MWCISVWHAPVMGSELARSTRLLRRETRRRRLSLPVCTRRLIRYDEAVRSRHAYRETNVKPHTCLVTPIDSYRHVDT